MRLGKRAATKRLVGGMVTACAAVAAWAPTAGAATVGQDSAVDPGVPVTVTYAAGAGEENDLVVAVVAVDPTTSRIQFTDAVPIDPAALSATSGCDASGLLTASCPLGSVTVNLGDSADTLTAATGATPLTVDGGEGPDIIVGSAGDDTLNGGDGPDTLVGNAGADTITGGPGSDAISAGAGDDTISANDGVADFVICGAGTDTVTADLGVNGVTDTLVDCETPPIPASAPAGGSTAPSTPPSGATAPSTTTTGTSTSTSATGTTTADGGATATTAATPVPVLAPGVASPRDLVPPGGALRATARQRLRTAIARGLPLSVTCHEACGISISLSIDRRVARRLGLSAPLGPAVVGTAIARRTGAGTNPFRVKFSKRAQRALRRTRRVRVTVQVLISDASGNATLLQRRVTLVR